MRVVTEAREVAVELAGLRRRDFRNTLFASATAHLVLIAAFMVSPPSSVSLPRGVVVVELIAAPASAVVVPAPKPPVPPKPKKIVLPAEPTIPKPKPKKVAKEVPQEIVERPPQPEPVPEQNYDDVLAQLRAESGESQPAPQATAAPAVAPGPPGARIGTGISPEVAAWLKRAKIHVRKNWVLQPGFRTQQLEAHVTIELDSGGNLRGAPKLTRRSGNPWYDEGVVRAIQKSSPLPVPPEAGAWIFVFFPEDSY